MRHYYAMEMLLNDLSMSDIYDAYLNPHIIDRGNEIWVEVKSKLPTFLQRYGRSVYNGIVTVNNKQYMVFTNII